MAIEAFCRYPTGATNAAERRVLWRAAEILEQNHHSAVILCDFFCGAQQIDLLIATEITTLLLQVKNYRHAIAGSTNSASWMNPASGESLPNAYTQATNQMLALKDMLRDRSGIDPGFARAAILFERGIPAGSSLPRSDFRVQICGAEALEGLLLTHTSECSSRRPWDLAQLRGYAIEERMARLADDALRKPVQPKLIHLAAQTSSRPCSIDATVKVMDLSVRSASSTLTPRVVAQPTLDRPPMAVPVRPQRTRRVRRYAMALVAAGVCFWWLPSHLPSSRLGATAASGAPSLTSSSHHPTETKRHRDHMAYASRRLPASASPVAPAVVNTPDVQPLTAMPNVAPLPRCPAGIDRIGCTPSSETLARLSGQ